MSSLKFVVGPEKVDEATCQLVHASEAVILGDIVKCAGQGGWDSDGKLDPDDYVGQVQKAFRNVDKILQAAGLPGWENVYSVRSYHVNLDATVHLMAEQLKKRIPGHRPLWTAMGVTQLYWKEMLIEIEVEAKRS